MLATRILLLVGLTLGLESEASEALDSSYQYQYIINPGDVLSVEVWDEAEISKEQVLVRPDGRIGLPIVGEVVVAGKTIKDAEADIGKRLASYMLDKPNVTVSTAALNGNTVYVLGKVARPGQFIIYGRMDVMQALALAGGTTTFADLNSIKILRRDNSGAQKAIKFNYARIEKGKDLEKNMYVKSGDVVVVP